MVVTKCYLALFLACLVQVSLALPVRSLLSSLMAELITPLQLAAELVTRDSKVSLHLLTS